MNKKRFLSLAVALLLAACSFTSCNDKTDSNNENQAVDNSADVAVVDEAKEEVDMSTVLELPEGKFLDGETFNLYIAYGAFKKNYDVTELTGNLIDDKTFERNQAVIDRTGVNLNFVASTLTTSGGDQRMERDKISSLILANDKTYDAFIHVQHTGMPSLINEGMFIDWNDLPYVKLEKPWWYSNVLRDICFGNKIFAMTGDYNLGTFTNTACLIFNKTMLDELELEYPYQMVFDGTWTHDRFVEYIQKATKDLNGDGLIDVENDRYGFNGWMYEQIPALYVGYGGVTLKKDDNNLPVLNIYSERQNSVIDAMIEVFKSDGSTWEGKTGAIYKGSFSEGRLLFVDGFFHHLPGYGNVEHDFGFVPYPKLNEQQEQYYSRSANIGCLTYIPVTLDEDRYEIVGGTLEAMAYYSNQIVLPTYFDIILTIKSTRDVESEQMIPIIKDTTRFMDEAIGFSPSNMVTSGQNTLASFWASNKTSYETKLEALSKLYTGE